jgi:hypothetical protein
MICHSVSARAWGERCRGGKDDPPKRRCHTLHAHGHHVSSQTRPVRWGEDLVKWPCDLPVSCPSVSRGFVEVCLCMALSSKAFLLPKKWAPLRPPAPLSLGRGQEKKEKKKQGKMTYCSSWVMTTSWKLACPRRCSMICRNASARDALLAWSRLVVGSSRARIPQLRQNVSANASLMIKHARTCTFINQPQPPEVSWQQGGTINIGFCRHGHAQTLVRAPTGTYIRVYRHVRVYSMYVYTGTHRPDTCRTPPQRLHERDKTDKPL